MTSHSCSDLLLLQDLRLDAPVLLMEKRTSLPLLPPSSVLPQSPFLTLAPELKQAIFSKLPQPSSLKAVVLTCSDFYHTFLGAKSLILKSVLCNEIGPDLLHDAIFAWQSRWLPPFLSFTEGTAPKLMKLYAIQNPASTSFLQIWKVRDAVALSSLHDDVKVLSKDFASLVLRTNIVTGQADPSPSPLSLLESNRIQRAFYRYERFCNLFRLSEDNPTVGVMGPGLALCVSSIWKSLENEQVTCVRDHLLERLMLRMCSWRLTNRLKQLTLSAFQDVAEHDVEWGELKVKWHYHRLQYNPWKEHYLSRGLSYLRQLFDAQTYDDRCRLLKPQGKKRLGVPLAQQEVLVRFTKEEEYERLGVKSPIDSDKGPEKALL